MSGAGATSRPGLYVHVPFCSRVCPYCDFAVRTGSPGLRAGYVETLLAEIDLVAPSPGTPGSFDTVYLGGGTPSLLEPSQLSRMLDALSAPLGVLPQAHVFLEANPEDVTADNVRAWRAIGVRTLSLGIQSLDDVELRFLGRRHSAGTALAAAALVRGGGFDTVSFDLIYGLPDQTPAAWRRTLEAAVSLAPDHLSCYQLSMPEATTFGKWLRQGKLRELPESEQAERFVLTHALLADAGYAAYEVSNFARSPVHRSQHNRKYWCHTPYLGIGPGAHSFGGGRRWWNERRLVAWQARVARGERPVAGEETLSPRDLALEALMLGLRTVEGVDLSEVRSRHGVDLVALNARRLEELVREGLVHPLAGYLRLTRRGLAIADGIASILEIGNAGTVGV